MIYLIGHLWSGDETQVGPQPERDLVFPLTTKEVERMLDRLWTADVLSKEYGLTSINDSMPAIPKPCLTTIDITEYDQEFGEEAYGDLIDSWLLLTRTEVERCKWLRTGIVNLIEDATDPLDTLDGYWTYHPNRVEFMRFPEWEDMLQEPQIMMSPTITAEKLLSMLQRLKQ